MNILPAALGAALALRRHYTGSAVKQFLEARRDYFCRAVAGSPVSLPPALGAGHGEALFLPEADREGHGLCHPHASFWAILGPETVPDYGCIGGTPAI